MIRSTMEGANSDRLIMRHDFVLPDRPQITHRRLKKQWMAPSPPSNCNIFRAAGEPRCLLSNIGVLMVTRMLTRSGRASALLGRAPQGINTLRGLESERAKDACHSWERRGEVKSRPDPIVVRELRGVGRPSGSSWGYERYEEWQRR